MTRKEKGTKLEQYIANKLIGFGDKFARPTRGSGNSTEIGDIYSKDFFVECKSKDKKNIVMDRLIIQHLKDQIPINSDRVPFWVYENKFEEKYIIIDADNFFRIIKK